MTRFSRQSLRIVGVILIALIVQSIYFAIYRDWTDYIRTRARRANVLMDASSIESRFPADIAIRQLGLVIPVGRLPLPLMVDAGELSLNLASLFAFSGNLDYRFDLYGGEASGVIRKGIFSETVNYKIQARGLQIERHPQLGRVLFKGELNFQSEGRLEPRDGVYRLTKAESRFELRNGEYSGGLRIRGLVEVPAVDNAELDAELKIDGESLDVSTLEFRSSLGDVSGRGSFKLGNWERSQIPAAGIESGSGEFSITLTELGAKTFAGYLQLAAGGKGTPQTRSWSGVIEFLPGQPIPNVRVSPE